MAVLIVVPMLYNAQSWPWSEKFPEKSCAGVHKGLAPNGRAYLDALLHRRSSESFVHTQYGGPHPGDATFHILLLLLDPPVGDTLIDDRGMTVTALPPPGDPDASPKANPSPVMVLIGEFSNPDSIAKTPITAMTTIKNGIAKFWRSAILNI